jgi:hypothetical protein
MMNRVRQRSSGRSWLGLGRRVMVVSTVALLSSVTASAQQPWTVTLTPTLNPLPVGFCGAVQLTLVDPISGDVPRRPDGMRVTMADFDMSVSGASVAGHQIDATHFDVCACQGGSPGGTAMVTARYPGRAVGATAAVRGVSFATTAPFTLTRPKGPTDPVACLTPTSSAAAPASVPVPAAASVPAPAPSPVGSPLPATVTRAAAPAPQKPTSPVVAVETVVATATPVVAPAPETPTAPAAVLGTVATTGTPFAPPVQLASPVLPGAMVVVREEWTIPSQGSISLSSGQCTIVNPAYTNSSIMATDTVIVTGQAVLDGAFLKWTATVDNGAIHINACNWKRMTLNAQHALYLNGRKLNILVLR